MMDLKCRWLGLDSIIKELDRINRNFVDNKFNTCWFAFLPVGKAKHH